MTPCWTSSTAPACPGPRRCAGSPRRSASRSPTSTSSARRTTRSGRIGHEPNRGEPPRLSGSRAAGGARRAARPKPVRVTGLVERPCAVRQFGHHAPSAGRRWRHRVVGQNARGNEAASPASVTSGTYHCAAATVLARSRQRVALLHLSAGDVRAAARWTGPGGGSGARRTGNASRLQGAQPLVTPRPPGESGTFGRRGTRPPARRARRGAPCDCGGEPWRPVRQPRVGAPEAASGDCERAPSSDPARCRPGRPLLARRSRRGGRQRSDLTPARSPLVAAAVREVASER